MFEKIKKIFSDRKRKKMLIKDEIKRKKINFVYRFLLDHHERRLKNQIDIPAFYYALDDMEFVIKKDRLNEAYKYARDFYRRQFEKDMEAYNG